MAALIGLLVAPAPTGAQVVPGGPPGAIRLLGGYQHERQQGIDTQVGRIWKNGGPEVAYDIGDFAGHHANEAEPRRWSKRQTMSGRTFTLTKRADDLLILTFEQGTANFFIKGIRTDEELVEVLLMLLTYNP